MKKILLTLLPSIIISANAATDTNSSIAVNSTDNTTAVTTTNSLADNMIINSSTILNNDILDKTWKIRDNSKIQTQLIKYLLTNPKYDRSNYETCWKVSRLVSYLGNFGYGYTYFTKDTSNGIIFFEYGYKAGLAGIKLKPTGTDANYWYAVNLGSYGLLKGIISSASNASSGMDALKIVKSSAQDSYDNYGAYRILGRYYQELPGMFGGSDSKAEMLLKEAVAKSNGFINNDIFLGNFYLHDKQYQNALTQCNNALTTKNIAVTKSEQARYTKEANECVTKATANI